MSEIKILLALMIIPSIALGIGLYGIEKTPQTNQNQPKEITEMQIKINGLVHKPEKFAQSEEYELIILEKEKQNLEERVVVDTVDDLTAYISLNKEKINLSAERTCKIKKIAGWNWDAINCDFPELELNPSSN